MRKTLEKTINIRQLRGELASIIDQVRKGIRFTVLYRSRPAFRIVPIDGQVSGKTDYQDDPLYQAKPLGRPREHVAELHHDEILYGRRPQSGSR